MDPGIRRGTPLTPVAMRFWQLLQDITSMLVVLHTILNKISAHLLTLKCLLNIDGLLGARLEIRNIMCLTECHCTLGRNLVRAGGQFKPSIDILR